MEYRRIVVGVALLALSHDGGSRLATLEVAADGSAPYTSIQDAIDAATPGIDDVFVRCGTYLETLSMKSGVSVRGEDAFCTVVDGQDSGSVVTIRNLPDARELSGFTLRSGLANLGGGILVENAAPVITRNVIEDNRANWSGGGVSVQSGADPALTAPDIRYNLFVGNSATLYDSAGIYVYGAVGARIASNVLLEQQGAAVTLYETETEATHNTIVRNTGHGVYIWSFSPVVLSGNVVAWNGGSGVYVYPGSAVTSRDNDVFGQTPNWSGTADPTGSNGNISQDPALVDERTSSFKGFQPRTDSPLVDAVVPASAPAEDLRGIPRPVDGGLDARSDIGARENEGLSRLHFDEKHVLRWDVGSYSPTNHGIYRGDLAVLKQTGDYTQNTADVSEARQFTECQFWLRDEVLPQPDQCLFYLGVIQLGGTLGFDSQAVERLRTGAPDQQPCLE